MIDVGAVEDFASGQIRIVRAADRELGIARWAGEWYAIRNVCPHRGAPVCVSGINPALSEVNPGDVDDVRVDDERPVIVCPWHRWEFEVRTGQAVTGPERLKMYPVHVRDGRVLVDADSRRPDRGREASQE
jgi:nitrite reductase (NADH) small subunit